MTTSEEWLKELGINLPVNCMSGGELHDGVVQAPDNPG
jgi:hypothetical protein